MQEPEQTSTDVTDSLTASEHITRVQLQGRIMRQSRYGLAGFPPQLPSLGEVQDHVGRLREKIEKGDKAIGTLR